MERRPFSLYIKDQVRHEQENRCAVCGRQGHLTIHHINPQSQGGTADRSNALGVCRTPCHDVLDQYAIHEKIYYPEVTMQPGFWYQIRRP